MRDELRGSGARVRRPPRSVTLEVTARCNQRCRYCYNPGRATGGATIPDHGIAALCAVVDRLAEQSDLRSLTITGGEPLVRPDLEDLIAALRERSLAITLISNGGLLTAERARRFHALGVSAVQLSLAGGDAATHDAVCGRGSFAGTVAAARHLATEGVALLGSFLCHAGSFRQAADAFDLLRSLGARRVAFDRFAPAGDARRAIDRLLPTRSQLLAALAATEERAATEGSMVPITFPIPPCVLDDHRYHHLQLGACSAGTEYGEPAVRGDGSFRLCSLQPEAVGSLHESSLASLLGGAAARAFRQQIPEFCRPCSQAASCLGGCGAAAAWVFGRARELDPLVAQHVMPDYAQRLRERRRAW